MAGYQRVDGYRWFDGKSETKFANGWTADWRCGDLYPNDIWVVLDSVYDLTKYHVNTNYETDLRYSLFFYGADKVQIGDSVYFNSQFNGWRTFKLDRKAVRFVRLKTYQSFASNTGLRDVQFTGKMVGTAENIFPVAGAYLYRDAGVKAHGMNYLGDRFDKLDLQDDTIVTKITKSVRWYESGNDFDYYPDTYTGRLMDAPLYLGRYTNNGQYGYEALSQKLRRRGLSPMFAKTGGTIKQATDINSISNNTGWIGWASADKRYTEPTAQPESDTAWLPLAEQYYRFITLWGSNPDAVQSGRVTGVMPANPSWAAKGQNTIDIMETGNEESRFWVQSYYLTPKAYYEHEKAIYRRGKQADSKMPIYAAALPGYDTTFWRAVWWSHYWSGGDVNNFPTDGFNFNMYLNNIKSEQAGSGEPYAISPEKWRIREEMQMLMDFFNRMFPNKQVQWTEFGYATDDVSPYDVNPIGEKSDRKVQADWTLRLKALVQSVPFISRMYYYSFFEDGTGPFNSMAVARDSNDWRHVIPQPVGYALGQELRNEADYTWFSSVVRDGDSTGVWVTKKNSVSDPKKVLYKVWRGTDANQTGSITINVGDAQSATIYRLRYDSWFSDSLRASITGGNITLAVGEEMVWIAAYEANMPIPPDPPIPPVPSDTAYVEKVVKKVKLLPYRLTVVVRYDDGTEEVVRKNGIFPLTAVMNSRKEGRKAVLLKFFDGSMRVIIKKGD
jgi:hypothetical protein